MPKNKDKRDIQNQRDGERLENADAFAEDNLEPDAEAKKDVPEIKTQAEPEAVASYEYPAVLQEGEAFVYYLEASWTGTDIEGTRERYQGMKESHIFDEAPPADNFIALDLSVRSNFDGIEDKFLSIAKCFMPVMENKMQATLAQAKKDGKEQDFFRTFQTNLKKTVIEVKPKFDAYVPPYPAELKEEVLIETLASGWQKERYGAEQRFAKIKETHVFDEHLPPNTFIEMDLNLLSEARIKEEIFSVAECFLSGPEARIKQNFEAAQKIGKAQDFAKEFQGEFKKSIANKEVQDAFAAKLAEEAKARHDEPKPETKGDKPIAPENLAESADDAIILASATLDPALHAGEDAKPSLTASAPTKEGPVDALDPGVGEEAKPSLTPSAPTKEGPLDALDPGVGEEAKPSLTASVPTKEDPVDALDPRVGEVTKTKTEFNDLLAAKKKTPAMPDEPQPEEEEVAPEDNSLMGKARAVWNTLTAGKKSGSDPDDQQFIDATGKSSTSLKPQSATTPTKATSANRANLSIDQIMQNFKDAIDAHNLADPSDKVDYELKKATKQSFTVTNNLDKKHLATVEKKGNNSIEYKFSTGAVDAKMIDVVFRATKEDKVLILHSSKLDDIEEILKAAAASGGQKIIKFDDDTEDFVKKLGASGKLDLYPTLKARVEEDAKPAAQKAAEAPAVKADPDKEKTSHPKHK